MANSGRFIFTVKIAFIQKFGITEGDTYELMTKYRMMDYLHNPVGPAMVDTEHGVQQWWIDGKPVDMDSIEKIKHNTAFSKEMEDLLK